VYTQPTANFGNTTFLEFCIALRYMDAHIHELFAHGAWKVQLASIEGANGHAAFKAGIAGGNSPSSTISSSQWSDSISIPEPTTISLIPLPAEPCLSQNVSAPGGKRGAA
jgi:hypothetical protein